MLWQKQIHAGGKSSCLFWDRTWKRDERYTKKYAHILFNKAGATSIGMIAIHEIIDVVWNVWFLACCESEFRTGYIVFSNKTRTSRAIYFPLVQHHFVQPKGRPGYTTLQLHEDCESLLQQFLLGTFHRRKKWWKTLCLPPSRHKAHDLITWRGLCLRESRRICIPYIRFPLVMWGIRVIRIRLQFGQFRLQNIVFLYELHVRSNVCIWGIKRGRMLFSWCNLVGR